MFEVISDLQIVFSHAEEIHAVHKKSGGSLVFVLIELGSDLSEYDLSISLVDTIDTFLEGAEADVQEGIKEAIKNVTDDSELKENYYPVLYEVRCPHGNARQGIFCLRKGVGGSSDQVPGINSLGSKGVPN